MFSFKDFDGRRFHREKIEHTRRLVKYGYVKVLIKIDD